MDSVRIKGSVFVDLPKSNQKPFAEKRSWQGHPGDFVQTQGQAQDRTRTTQGHAKDKKDISKTSLGQAEDKKGRAKGSHRGNVQFYQIFN